VRVTSPAGQVVSGAGSDLSLSLTWRNVGPDDQPIDTRVCDIPWITGLSWTRLLPESRILLWEESAGR